MEEKLNPEPFETEDLIYLKKWLLHEEVYKNLNILYHPKNLTDLNLWYKNEIENSAQIFKFSCDENIIGMG